MAIAAHEHSHDHSGAKVVAIGTVTVSGVRYAVDREGECVAGATCTFGVERITTPVTPSIVFLAWVVGADSDEPLSEPVAGVGHEDHYHFEVAPRDGTAPTAFVLRAASQEGEPLPLSPGAAPGHGGILAAGLADGEKAAGFVEVKLHDDLGDLELWLSANAAGDPLDVPADTVVRLTFPSHGGKTAQLRVRNEGQNEDEDGAPNMRGGATNYFVFPGDSGADAAWLQGAKWRGVCEVAFEARGATYACPPFVLVPHSAL